MIDPRLEVLKKWNRAMMSYVLTLHEITLESHPKYVLEIGTQYGQSCKSMLLALLKNGRGLLVSIDHKDRKDILDVEFEDCKPYWKFIKSDSHLPSAVEEASKCLPEGEYFDMAFIDGDHTYEGVKADFNDYKHLIKPGGIIIFHDTSNRREGVEQFWNEITWEKFNFNWGHAAKNVIPGFGMCRKPLE